MKTVKCKECSGSGIVAGYLEYSTEKCSCCSGLGIRSIQNYLEIGDYREVEIPEDVSLMIADPVYDTGMISNIISLGIVKNWPTIVFCSVEDSYRLDHTPDQTCFWFKPYSTKNTSKHYSNFVEPILFYGVQFHKMLHWSTRIGIFQDTLIDNTQHEWKKPDSLIEKLILNHYPGHGMVFDPCAGSGTTHNVCKRLGIPSFCVEIDSKYEKFYL